MTDRVSRGTNRFLPRADMGGGSGGLAEVYTDYTAWVMPDHGDDATGTVGRLDLPFATVQAAITAIYATGDTQNWLIILPGVYAEDVVWPAAPGNKRLTILGSGRPTTVVRSLEINAGVDVTNKLYLDVEDLTIGARAANEVLTKAPLSFVDELGSFDVQLDHCDIISTTADVNAVEANITSLTEGLLGFAHCYIGRHPQNEPVPDISAIVSSAATVRTEMCVLHGSGHVSCVVVTESASLDLRETELSVAGESPVVYSESRQGQRFEDVIFYVTTQSATDAVQSASEEHLTFIGHAVLVNDGGGGGVVTVSGTVTFETLVDNLGTKLPIAALTEQRLLVPDRDQVSPLVAVVGPTWVATEQRFIPCDTVAAAAPMAVVLPRISVVGIGKKYTVKDVTGAAGANPITVSGVGVDTFDGAASVVIDTDYGCINVVAWSATVWSVCPIEGGDGGAEQQMAMFTANDAIIPASAGAGVSTRNQHGVMAFDDTDNESVIFEGVLPGGYDSGDPLVVRIHWSAGETGEVIGNVKWLVEWEAIAPNVQDLDVDGFAAAKSVVTTTSGTNGVTVMSTISFSNAEADAIAATNPFRLRLTRDAEDVDNDTLFGDAQVIRVSVEQS